MTSFVMFTLFSLTMITSFVSSETQNVINQRLRRHLQECDPPCDPASDRPYCGPAFTPTGTACQCGDDADCINGGTCGQPSCVTDIMNYCSIDGHDVDWGCPPTCDPPCDPASDAPHCHVIGGDAMCGCLTDTDCTAPQVCAHRDHYIYCDSTNGYLECAKHCGCVAGTSIGCDLNSNPFCIKAMSFIGTVCSECRNDSDCISPETCGMPSCIVGRNSKTCDTDHDASYGCT